MSAEKTTPATATAADVIEPTRVSVDDAALDTEATMKGQAADEGYELFTEAGEISYTEEESAAVRRKLDLHLLPLMCFLYGICYVDKACLSWAVLFNFREDLNLTGDQYSWGSSVFYFGYLVAQYPFNYLLQKYKTGRVLGYCVCSWGVLMIAYVHFSLAPCPRGERDGRKRKHLTTPLSPLPYRLVY
jgi:MFS transporter, ACS family, allantoate permease